MRIIAGRWKNKTIHYPRMRSLDVMSDMSREALFNILGSDIEGARFADLFAGSGGVGLEALSRGAERVTFVERKRQAAQSIKDSLEAFDIGLDEARVWQSDVFQLNDNPSEWAEWDVVFLDPPHNIKDNFLDTLVARNIVAEGVLTAVHRQGEHATAPRTDSLHLLDERRYGKSALFFYE